MQANKRRINGKFLISNRLFKYMSSIQPSLKNDNAVLKLIERYNVKKIKFSKKAIYDL